MYLCDYSKLKQLMGHFVFCIYIKKKLNIIYWQHLSIASVAAVIVFFIKNITHQLVSMKHASHYTIPSSLMYIY